MRNATNANIPAAYENAPKPLAELSLIDNFLFNRVLIDAKDGEKVARILFETILGRKAGEIAVTVQQTFPALSTNRKGSITDLLIREKPELSTEEAAPEKNQKERMKTIPDVYDLEAETKEREKADLPRRTRFYHSIIDRTVLPSGALYRDLPDVYVIVITNFDPFDRDRIIYTGKTVILEEQDLEYNDGIKTIYLNTTGSVGNVRQEVRELLRYMMHSDAENAVNEDLRLIQSTVDRIKSMEEVSIEYMKSWEVELYAREEGREEGREEERKNTIAEKKRADEATQRADEAEAEARRLRARIAELEAEAAASKRE